MPFSKGVSGQDTPFSFWRIFVSLLLTGGICTAHAGGCPAVNSSERVQVAFVYDGDTVKLADGRRLRIIGINTPEISHTGQPSQALAAQAKASLTDLLDKHTRVLLLQYGQEHHDHYGRLLAHAFLEDGDNLAVYLLEQGLATTLVVPPNTWGQSCYQAVEDVARTAGRGLWALPDYKPSDHSALPPDASGFHIVHGRITAIRPSRHSVWLDLGGPLAIHIARKDLVNFKPGFLDSIKGKPVEIRGWIKGDKQDLRLKVRHPAALRVLAAGNTQ
jgi:endonuclease YncB( thermonuclease family)